jgi:enolase-phosphatase E1
MKYILTDIEGTTTSISFVHDVLFPYSKNILEQFVFDHMADAVVKNCVNEAGNIATLLKWIDEDRKEPALKTLQGLIWEEGYKSGELKGHVYDDVPVALEKWQAMGIKMGVYSSGSVHAQKLIFGFSVFGDLNKYLSHYFDTGVGHKREPQSYQNIVNELKLNPNDILFLSDIVEELDAAKKIGMKTLQLVRSNIPTSINHKTVKSFSEISVQ